MRGLQGTFPRFKKRLPGNAFKVGSHEEFFPVALVLGVKYPMHHNFLSIRS